MDKSEDAEFAGEVRELFKAAVSGQWVCYKNDPSEEVRRAGFGLALIRQLLDELARVTEKSAQIPASGIREAYGIIDYLTDGRDHPIARHVNGLRSGRFRPQHAPVNSVEKAAQAVLVAVCRAYKDAANLTQSKAIHEIIRGASPFKCFTYDQIRSWDKRLNKEDAALVKSFESRLLHGTGRNPEEVLSVGMSWIWKWWAVPEIPRQK